MDFFNRLEAINFLFKKAYRFFSRGSSMRHILIINPKGGCGKSTIATSIAGYYADAGKDVALADYDTQESSMTWLKSRPENRPRIIGIQGHLNGLSGIPKNIDLVVMDAPARANGRKLRDLIRLADTIIFPVLPSPIDIDASIGHLEDLLSRSKIVDRKAKIALVANRVKENTLSFDKLDSYLEKQKIPYVATLRESQNYIKCFERGLGIHELAPYLAYTDWEQWQPLIDWLESKRSLPTN
jgi:chromosome partitioning protein